MELYLEHHGILGQRWGVRRFQNADGSLTAKGRVRYGYGSKNSITKDESKIKSIVKEKITQIDKKLVESGLKKTSKALTAIGSYPLSDFKEQFKSEHNIGHTPTRLADTLVKQGLLVDYDDTGTLSGGDRVMFPSGMNRGRYLPEGQRTERLGWSDISLINPDYGEDGTTNNCVRCALATELMQQGYSSIRAGRSRYGGYMGQVSEYFEGAKTKNVSNYGTDIDDYMRKNYGNNTSGVWNGIYPTGTGHALHWSIDSKGSVQVEDGQSSKLFKSFNDAIEHYGFDRDKGGAIVRLDNCKPKFDKLENDGMYKVQYTKVDGHQTNLKYGYATQNKDGSWRGVGTTYSEARDDAKRQLYEEYKDWKKKTYFNY